MVPPGGIDEGNLRAVGRHIELEEHGHDETILLPTLRSRS